MKPEYQALFDRIDALAQKLGVTAKLLWAIYMKQAAIDGVENVLWLIGTSAGLMYIARNWRKWEKKERDPIDGGIWKLIIGIIAVALVIAFSAALDGALTDLINPEAYAFKEIMGAIK